MANPRFSQDRSLPSICPDCRQTRLVKDSRQVGKRCFDCFIKDRNAKANGSLVQVGVSKSGKALFDRVCVDCRETARVEKKDALRPRCRVCSGKARATHGCSRQVGGPHPLYRVIKSAIARCAYPAVKDYQWYGGRGITVCEEWRTNPASFIEWAMANGWQRGLELDRKNNDGNYEPGNCRFITHKENCRNRRNSPINRAKKGLI